MSQNTQSLNQTTSYAHWIAFFYLHAHIKISIHLSHLKSEKKAELNELSELEYSKTPSQMSSYAQWHAFLYLHAQTSIKTSNHLSDLKSEKKDWAKWARIFKSPSQMSSFAHKHVFLYLHAQTNINALFYWFYTKL